MLINGKLEVENYVHSYEFVFKDRELLKTMFALDFKEPIQVSYCAIHLDNVLMHKDDYLLTIAKDGMSAKLYTVRPPKGSRTNWLGTVLDPEPRIMEVAVYPVLTVQAKETKMSTYEKEPIWTTADGRELTAKQMTLEHLTNARGYLARRIPNLEEAVDSCRYGYPCFQGEMAQDHAEWEWDRNIDRAQARLQSTRDWIKRFSHEITYRHAKSKREQKEALSQKRIDSCNIIKKDSLSNIQKELMRLADSQNGAVLTINRQFIYELASRIRVLIGE